MEDTQETGQEKRVCVKETEALSVEVMVSQSDPGLGLRVQQPTDK